MNNITKAILMTAAAMSFGACCQKAEEPEPIKIAIFSEHIQSAARQGQISFREAAQKFRDLGFQGVDVDVKLSEENMAILDELGFEHAATHAHIYFSDNEQEESAQQCIDFMTNHHFDKVLLVPGFLTEQETEEEWNTIINRTAAFAKKAAAAGIDVMLEDYDNKMSPTFNTTRLDKMFAAIPELNFVYDSGNFAYAGDAVLPALEHFKSRVHHVHLKDRLAYRDLASPAVGGGILPMMEMVRRLQEYGYDGWFTVEHFSSRRMLEDAEYSIKTLRGEH